MPEVTAATVVDGWLHTGDLVTVNDDGTYTFVSRKKEVLRRRGQNLSPAEVEDAIGVAPGRARGRRRRRAVRADRGRGQGVRGRRGRSHLDFEELRAWTAARLSAFKVPRFWQAVESLPRTPTSRVAKHRLPTGHPAEEYDAEPPTPGGRGRRRCRRELDPEEQVEVLLGEVRVATHGPEVAAAEGGQHQAAGVELDEGGQVVDLALARRSARPG